MKKVFRLILLLLFTVTSSNAQDTGIHGKAVSAEDRSPVPFANLMIYSLPDSTLLGFAVSSDDGSFTAKLSSAPADMCIKVSCIGFKKETIHVGNNTNDIIIRLQPDSKMLDAVVVKGRAPGIKVTGDTVDYNFRKYTIGNERVLKDILKKLPGLDVDEKGQVTANGEAVKKILIDGQDFFGNQNEQITNNLPAKMVDKIQLQKNYSEYSLLKGFNTHRATVLNVGIDSVYNGRLTGNAELLGGWPHNYRSSLNIYSFGKKALWGFNAKYFNTGEEVMTLLDYIKLLGSVSDYAQSFGGASRVVDNGISLPSFLTSNINTERRRNALVSTNIAWNPNERLKLNAYYMFNFEASRGRQDIYRTYPGQDRTESLLEEADTRRYFHLFGLNMKYSMGDNAALDSRTTITAMPQTDRQQIDAILSDDKIQDWNLNQQMSFIKNWSNRNLLSVSGELTYNNRHCELQIQSDSTLYDLPEDQHDVRQTQRHSLLDVYLSTSWIHRLSHAWQMDMSGGWNIIRDEISADASWEEFDIPAQSMTTNIYDYSMSFSKKKGFFQMNGGLTLASIHNRYEHKPVLLPDIKLTLAFSSTNSVSLSYSSSYKIDDNVYLHGMMLNDYRQYTTLTEQQNTVHRKDRLHLSVNYFDILNEFSFIMNAGYTFTDRPYISNYQSAGQGVKVSLQQADRDGQSQYVYLNIKKTFLVPLTVTFKSTLMNSLYQTAYEGILSNDRTSSLDGSIALTSKWKGPVNMEVGYKLTLQQSKTGLDGQTFNFAEHDIYVKPILLRKDCFDFSIPVSYILDHSYMGSFHNFDVGVSATYTVKQWTFSVEGHNMLHTHDYRRLRIETRNDYHELITENRLPGYIIVGTKLMF